MTDNVTHVNPPEVIVDKGRVVIYPPEAWNSPTSYDRTQWDLEVVVTRKAHELVRSPYPPKGGQKWERVLYEDSPNFKYKPSVAPAGVVYVVGVDPNTGLVFFKSSGNGEGDIWAKLEDYFRHVYVYLGEGEDIF